MKQKAWPLAAILPHLCIRPGGHLREAALPSLDAPFHALSRRRCRHNGTNVSRSSEPEVILPAVGLRIAADLLRLLASHYYGARSTPRRCALHWRPLSRTI